MRVLLTRLWVGGHLRGEPLEGREGEPAAAAGEHETTQIGRRDGGEALQARSEAHDADAPQPLMKVDPHQWERESEQLVARVDYHDRIRPARRALNRGNVWGRISSASPARATSPPGRQVHGQLRKRRKREGRKTRTGSRWLRRAMVECACAVARRRDTALAARFRRLVGRRGPKAAVAVGHPSLTLVSALLAHGEVSQEPSPACPACPASLDERGRRAQQRAIDQLRALGDDVAVTRAPAATYLRHLRTSYRRVEELLVERGIAVTYETIRQWCRKFGWTLADGERRRRPGDWWHIDEVPLGLVFWEGHNQDAAGAFLRRVVDGHGSQPRVVITDKLTMPRREPAEDENAVVHVVVCDRGVGAGGRGCLVLRARGQVGAGCRQ